MGWSYFELGREVDRRERRATSLRFAVLVASGVSIQEAQIKAAGRTTPDVSADADPDVAPVSLNSLGEILAAIARVTPTPPPAPTDVRVARILGLINKETS